MGFYYCALSEKWLKGESFQIIHLLKQDTLSVQLEKKDAVLKALKKELEIASDREAESLLCLEILDVVAQEWALEVNSKISDFVTKEVSFVAPHCDTCYRIKVIELG